jgi:hypothetical protein
MAFLFNVGLLSTSSIVIETVCGKDDVDHKIITMPSVSELNERSCGEALLKGK